MVWEAGVSIEGIQIDISEDNIDFQVQPILPLPIVQGRFIAPWHNVYWYTDNSAFQQGIATIEHAYHQKGIDDYVIVKFYLPDHSTPDERRAVLQTQVAGILNVAEAELSDSLLKVHPDGMGALKKAAPSPSGERGADGIPNFIWSPHQKVSPYFHSL